MSRGGAVGVTGREASAAAARRLQVGQDRILLSRYVAEEEGHDLLQQGKQIPSCSAFPKRQEKITYHCPEEEDEQHQVDLEVGSVYAVDNFKHFKKYTMGRQLSDQGFVYS